jgi:hypothetical protein
MTPCLKKRLEKYLRDGKENEQITAIQKESKGEREKNKRAVSCTDFHDLEGGVCTVDLRNYSFCQVNGSLAPRAS